MTDTLRVDAPTGRRKDLLDAALGCFVEFGYASTTVEMIRERADASIGSLYHHFDGKEALASALYLDLLISYEAGYEEALASASNAEAGVRGVVAHHLDWAENRSDDARFLLEHPHLERVLARSDRLPERSRLFYVRVQAWLNEQIKMGQMRRLSPDLYHALWLGPAQELARHWLAGRARSRPTDVAETLGEAAWDALKSNR